MNGSGRGWNFDRGFGIVCVLLGVAFAYGSLTLDEGMTFQQIGRDVWPSILSVTLMLVGIAIVLESSRPSPVSAEEDNEALPRGVGHLILFVAILMAVPVTMYLGFLAGGVFLMGVVLLIKETRDHTLRAVICAITLPTGVYFLFTRVFDQYLPTGSLF